MATTLQQNAACRCKNSQNVQSQTHKMETWFETCAIDTCIILNLALNCHPGLHEFHTMLEFEYTDDSPVSVPLFLNCMVVSHFGFYLGVRHKYA